MLKHAQLPSSDLALMLLCSLLSGLFCLIGCQLAGCILFQQQLYLLFKVLNHGLFLVLNRLRHDSGNLEYANHRIHQSVWEALDWALSQTTYRAFASHCLGYIIHVFLLFAQYSFILCYLAAP